MSLLTGGLWNVLQEVPTVFSKKCECLEYGLHSANVATGELAIREVCCVVVLIAKAVSEVQQKM